MRIDVHAHYWAAEYLDRLTELGRPDLARAGRQRDDLDERLAEMDRVGVDVQIFSAIGLNTVMPTAAGALEGARCINDIYVEVRERFGGRFTGFGSVPLPFVEEAIAESDRCLGELGLAGIALPCSVDGVPIDDERFEPFWENLARHDAVVYVHPVGGDSTPHPGLADWGLSMAYGSPTQVAVAAERMVWSGLTYRHPSLRLIFAMCGGTLPLIWTRHETNLLRGLRSTAAGAVGARFFDFLRGLPIDERDPMAGLRRFWYDTSVQDIPTAMLLARQSYGVDRLLLGSDSVFASLTEAVEYIRDNPHLSESEKDAILDRNAQSLLRLPELGGAVR